MMVVFAVVMLKFQFAPPRGGRPGRPLPFGVPRNFNSRPREGGDIHFLQFPESELISIRAPARGATSCSSVRHGG